MSTFQLITKPTLPNPADLIDLSDTSGGDEDDLAVLLVTSREISSLHVDTLRDLSPIGGGCS